MGVMHWLVLLVPTYLAKSGKKFRIAHFLSCLLYGKTKVELTPDMDVDAILEAIKEKFKDQEITAIDGVKIDFPDKWVHLRKSNTEPIIRVYSEARSVDEAENIGKQIIEMIKGFK